MGRKRASICVTERPSSSYPSRRSRLPFGTLDTAEPSRLLSRSIHAVGQSLAGKWFLREMAVRDRRIDCVAPVHEDVGGVQFCDAARYVADHALSKPRGASNRARALLGYKHSALAFTGMASRVGGTVIKTRIENHTFRATGITVYVKNKGTLEAAQHIANHESPRTTKFCDQRQDEVSLHKVERIAI